MRKLLVKKLDPRAQLPQVSRPGEDLGFDIFALEDTFLERHKQVVVRTGIAAQYVDLLVTGTGGYGTVARFGLEAEDRSGMAAKHGIHILAGKIDASYNGEIGIVLILLGPPKQVHCDGLDEGIRVGYWIKAGDKIAQLLPRRVYTDAEIEEVGSLPYNTRGDAGFGSSGR